MWREINIADYLDSIKFDPVCENLLLVVETFKKEGIEAEYISFEHQDDSLSFFYTLTLKPEGWDHLKSEINIPLFAFRNRLVNRINFCKKENKTLMPTETQYLLQLKALLDQNEFEQEIMTEENRKKIIESINEVIYDRFQGQFSYKSRIDKIKNAKEIEERKAYEKQLIIVCHSIFTFLVLYKKLFNVPYDKKLDLFILKKSDEIINTLRDLEFSETGIEVKTLILRSLLEMQYLNPKKNIIVQKDINNIKKKIEEYLSASLSNDDRVIVYVVMEMLGLIKEIKEEK